MVVLGLHPAYTLGASFQHAIPWQLKRRLFYERLGRRIAERRKALDITQAELAQTPGIAERTMAHYEGGVSRIAVAPLPPLASALDTSVEELLREDTRRSGIRGIATTAAARASQSASQGAAKARQPDARDGVVTGEPLSD
jgi:transcriptional regulator with XRE-family HTH domain